VKLNKDNDDDENKMNIDESTHNSTNDASTDATVYFKRCLTSKNKFIRY
jgi:hypothetical protein